jgi:hypothetical protein
MPEEPVIITGGSVTLDFSDNFKDDGASGTKKKYKCQSGKLVRIEVNDVPIKQLQPNDVVRIILDNGR